MSIIKVLLAMLCTLYKLYFCRYLLVILFFMSQENLPTKFYNVGLRSYKKADVHVSGALA